MKMPTTQKKTRGDHKAGQRMRGNPANLHVDYS